jgi:hypothetical protein
MSMAKSKSPVVDSDNVELVLSSKPFTVLDMVKNGQADLVSTKQLNIFYVRVDAAEKFVKDLKEKSRQIVIDRREEGEKTGDKQQHRHFEYATPQGHVELTVQERRSWAPNEEKLAALLQEKKLWEKASSITIRGDSPAFFQAFKRLRRELEKAGAVISEEIDLERVSGLVKAKLISLEEFESVLDKPDPTYALIGRLKT